MKLDRTDFRRHLWRLFQRFNRPKPSTDVEIAFYQDMPEWVTSMQMDHAVTAIGDESDAMPQNVVRAIVSRCDRPRESNHGYAIDSEFSVIEATRNRNRIKALMWLTAKDQGHKLRDRMVAIEGASLMKDGKMLDWRDPWTQKRYKPVIEQMEEFHKTTRERLGTEMLRVLDMALVEAHGEDAIVEEAGA